MAAIEHLLEGLIDTCEAGGGADLLADAAPALMQRLLATTGLASMVHVSREVDTPRATYPILSHALVTPPARAGDCWEFCETGSSCARFGT